MVRILAIGDIVGEEAVELVCRRLDSIKKERAIDFCIANGENCASGMGINTELAEKLCDAGVDCITLGNHTFRRSKEALQLFESGLPVVRPANYPPGTAGIGGILVDSGNISIGIINVMGRVYLENIDCPFRAAEREIKKLEGHAQIILMDVHAEATSEKLAIAHHFKGRICAVVGTHTHVQTADERILEGGTAYITDLGMTGPINSILGMKEELAIARLLKCIPMRYEVAKGECCIQGVIIDADEYTGRAEGIERVCI